MDLNSHQLTLDKIITTKQWKKILKELELTKGAGPDYYLCLLTWHTGLWVSKLANLRWSDIDLDAQFLKVREGKGAKPRTVYFGEKVGSLLSEYKSHEPRKDKASYKRKKSMCEIRLNQ